MRLIRYFLLLLLAFYPAAALEFSLIQKETDPKENTLLVIGGIQGDEPGGFNAAAVLSTHYTITKGNVWIVPNLNFYSIIKRSRGVYGDMNRKFAAIESNDPEYETVQRIRSIIADDRVDLVVNLHDGSGFYREEHIDHSHNPYRWGQSCIIDQEQIDAPKYGNLKAIADFVTGKINTQLVDEEHRYHVRNTRTREGDEEMAKTLTYFAINNGKPAFGNEGSKEFGTHYRAYYHLLALEAYMDYMGIEYERHFELTPSTLKRVIDQDYTITLFDKIKLPIKDTRRWLKYIPADSEQVLYAADNPLICAVREGKNYRVHYGNRSVTTLSPEYFRYDDSLDKLTLTIDGRERHIALGETAHVRDCFAIADKEGYRINVIGYSNKKKAETGVTIYKKDMPKRFSIDNKGSTFRIEVYKENKFSGMFLVKFVNATSELETTTALKSSAEPFSGS